MLDLMKRLAELDAGNPRVYNDTPTLNHQGVAEDKDVDEEKADEGPEILKIKSDQAKAKGEKSFNVGNKTFPVKEGDDEQVEECGMMPMGAMSGMSNHHHTPASINISADSGDELSAMLRDIMTLAGRGQEVPDSDMDMAEPAGEMPPPAEISTDDGDDMGMDEPSMMRSMIDKLNPSGDQDNDSGEDDESEKDDMKEYDNEPAPETSGYDSMTPKGNDLSSKGGNEVKAVSGGGNPYSNTMEEIQNKLFLEYKKFVNE